MKIQLLRHATLLLEMNGIKLLLDPMLSPAEINPPIISTPNPRKNPLVSLPVSDVILDKYVRSIDGVLLTHTHGDHFDSAAARILPKELPMLCQPSDTCKLSGLGFQAVLPVRKNLLWKNLNISRTGGRHGKGVTAKLMGKVSGYYIEAPHEPSIYVTGDTIWCKAVEEALDTYHPDIILAFAGAAQFVHSAPITMDFPDIEKVCEKAPHAKVIAVHMEALNHCMLTRELLRNHLNNKGLLPQVKIPFDGEWIELEKNKPLV